MTKVNWEALAELRQRLEERGSYLILRSEGKDGVLIVEVPKNTDFGGAVSKLIKGKRAGKQIYP